MADEPFLPDYTGPCITNVAAAVQHPSTEVGDWVPRAVAEAERSTVLLTIDGLGWEQLCERTKLAPTLCGVLEGGPVSAVAPSTTSTALTSIASGLPPGEHGVIGYRMAIDGRVLNVLRWATEDGDARTLIPPVSFQRQDPFGGERPPVVTKAEFATSGFTDAHLGGARFVGYRTLGTLVTEVDRLVSSGEPFVYAYYEGIDKVAHEYGLGRHYDSELRWVDHLVAELLATLPTGTCVAVTADHGQVEVGNNLVELDRGIRDHLSMQSGEGRFRWLHARPGRASQLREAAEAHADTGWILTRDQMIDEGWFGPRVDQSVRNRLGDVALVARDPVAYVDPLDTGPYVLIGRHGSMTEAEMLVPFIAATV
ncbi:MAG: alkaline phosphatase family protein [Acidimicrobiales bacterium]|nr:alkaline phosphatase family protein [Acidimicrobiales bacterium]